MQYVDEELNRLFESELRHYRHLLALLARMVPSLPQLRPVQYE